MKAVRNAPPSVEVVDVDEPDGEGELVRVVATGICASDLKYLRWGSTQIAGHEFAGVLEDGTAVAVEGFFGCGQCEQCGQGTYNMCAKGPTAPGMLNPGGMKSVGRIGVRRGRWSTCSHSRASWQTSAISAHSLWRGCS